MGVEIPEGAKAPWSGWESTETRSGLSQRRKRGVGGPHGQVRANTDDLDGWEPRQSLKVSAGLQPAEGNPCCDRRDCIRTGTWGRGWVGIY